MAEHTFAVTVFGTVTSRRVIYRRSRTWFRGGIREDIPLQQVTAVRLDIRRSIGFGALLLAVGLLLPAVDPALGLAGLATLGLAVLLLWGSPAVIVGTAGCELIAAQGYPWERADASTFVEALRGQLFKGKS